MTVVLTPVDTIVLTVGAETVECQVTSHTLTDADQGGGTPTRTGCGDIVNIPADTTEVGTLALTLFPERGDTGFLQWTWTHAGETAQFSLTVTDSGGAKLQWTGDITVSAIQETQKEYTKKETTDVSWSVTAWTTRAVSIP
jgi:hypothetical protein